MTYADLLAALSNLTAEQLDMTVTAYDPFSDEYIPSELVFTTDDQDVLDPDHPVIRLI